MSILMEMGRVGSAKYMRIWEAINSYQLTEDKEGEIKHSSIMAIYDNRKGNGDWSPPRLYGKSPSHEFWGPRSMYPPFLSRNTLVQEQFGVVLLVKYPSC